MDKPSMLREDASLHFTGAAGSVAVTVCTPRIVRASLGASQTSEASAVDPRVWASTPFEIAHGEPVRIATSDLWLEGETNPVRLTFADAAGAWLVREAAEGMAIAPSGGAASSAASRGAPIGAQNTVKSTSMPARTAPAVVSVSSLTRKCWVSAWMSRKRRWSGLLA
jgi:Domain of unknown function (DUF4968)